MRKGKTRILTAVFTMVVIGAMMLPIIASAGSLEPSAAPAPTMKTLDEIYNKLNENGNKLDASYNRLGALRFQVVLPNDEAVLDNNTGLVWERSTDPTKRTWDQANTYCNDLALGGKDDWRLPAKDELLSLVHITQLNPALPLGHPFINVNAANYWSSTAYTYNPSYAWSVSFYYGTDGGYVKGNVVYVRCVRGGQ